jgi:hypothetical protein
MALEMARTIQVAERRCLSDVYLGSPFRTRYFVLPSLLCLFDLVFIAIILVNQWERLPGRSIFPLGLAAFCLLMGWLMAFRTQRTVHRYLKTALMEKPEPGSPLETGFYVAGYITYYGSLWTFGAVACCLGAFGEFFIH